MENLDTLSNFSFIDDLIIRFRLQRLYFYIEKNKLWDTVKNAHSFLDTELDGAYYDLEYSLNFDFSVDISHMRSIAIYGWEKYMEEIERASLRRFN